MSKISDEEYVINLCDSVLKRTSFRRFRFDFLRGDPGKNGSCRKLPVDAYYDDLKLVVEYQEVQHFETVLIMDKRPTCSDCNRGEQRKIYDQRRRDVLPKNGISLIELPYYLFKFNSKKRFVRYSDADRIVVQRALSSKGHHSKS